MATVKKSSYPSLTHWHAAVLVSSALIGSMALLGILYLIGASVVTSKYAPYWYQINDHTSPVEIGFWEADQTQAIFLTNGQVYFGNITVSDKYSIQLENVFYIQVDGELQGDNGDVSGLSLVKLGDGEVHAPQDGMVISREQVLFWENLTDDSAVVAAMEEYAANGEFTAVDKTESPEEVVEEDTADEVADNVSDDEEAEGVVE